MKNDKLKNKKIDMINEVDGTKVSKDDFVYVQQDKAIHDLKFETQPTTFFKDAMRRFVKNRSSVIATYIIGFLMLLAIFVPILNRNDINTSQNELRFLPPRWPGFANTSVLNGKTFVNGVVVDMDHEDGPLPVGYVRDAIIGDIELFDAPITSASPYGRGGSVLLSSDGNNQSIGYRSSVVETDLTNTYDVEFVLDETLNNALSVAPVYSFYVDVRFDGEENYTALLIEDESSIFGTLTYADISATVLAEKPVAIVSDVAELRFRLHVKATKEPDARTRMYINSFNVTNALDAEDDTFAAHNFADGNAVLARNGVDDLLPYIFQITGGAGTVSLINGQITRGNFKYDPYEAAFGKRTMRIGISALRKYKNSGLIDFTEGAADDGQAVIDSFVVLSKKSPVLSLDGFDIITTGSGANQKTILEFDTTVMYYLFLGRNHMPNFLFGTNQFGHDYFKTVFYGLGISLLLGFVIATLNIIIGLVWGAVSGYYGGTIDLVMERITDILGGVPTIVVLTLIILHLGNSFGVFILAMTMTGWIGTSASTRSQFYRYKRREYVLASRTLGANDRRLIFRHILPNSIGPIVTSAVLMIPGVIFTEATISYLGLGLKGLPSLGVAISDVQEYIFQHPYLIVSGSIVISLLMISFNLFGNGLRDAFNPSLKGVDE